MIVYLWKAGLLPSRLRYWIMKLKYAITIPACRILTGHRVNRRFGMIDGRQIVSCFCTSMVAVHPAVAREAQVGVVSP